MNENKPLSCYRNIHFYKKVGKDSVCMYCGLNYWEELKRLSYKVQECILKVQFILNKYKNKKEL
jgi:hypothetical protein